MNTYIHKTANRIRVRSDFIRMNRDQVINLIDELEKIEAIKTIKFMKHAGSVAITFDSNEIEADHLLEILQTNKWMDSEYRNFYIENAAVMGFKTLLKGAATLALSRTISPFLANKFNLNI